MLELVLIAIYRDGRLDLIARGDGQVVSTLPLDQFDPADALELIEMGFGDPGRVTGLSLADLDLALNRNGWSRSSPWQVRPTGESLALVRQQ